MRSIRRIFAGMTLLLLTILMWSVSGSTGNAQTDRAVLALYPLSGAPGSTVTVIGNGFPPDATVNLRLEPDTTQSAVNVTRTIDGRGAFVEEIALPAAPDATGNPWRITATVLSSGDTTQSQPFFVTSRDDDNSSVFTQTQIYLINTSQATGARCNESLVPVTIDIEPTVAPLTAGLNRMFGYQARGNIGDVGPRNVFWQSPALRVASIDIENRMATINLTGTLNRTGDCDDIYMPAQIRQTALQYRTIDSVEIFHNGQPLGDDNSSGNPPAFTETSIYLVQTPFNETDICQEPLRPTTIQIEETVAPLTQALTAMFQDPNARTGNLYNAFAGASDTDLYVRGIDIENKTAIIDLGGRLVPTGNCDAAWMPGQIRQTALQYRTIDSVEIFYNGQRFEDILAQRSS